LSNAWMKARRVASGPLSTTPGREIGVAAELVINACIGSTFSAALLR
jgi:hypothetical protein